MKPPKLLVFASGVLLLSGLAIFPKADRIFPGEIMDSLCAEVGSHSTITKEIKASRDCTISCVQAGAKYVLYNEHWRAAFRLDNQQTPRAFAGEKVMVIGTYDRVTNTIHVRDIQPMYANTVETRAWMVWDYLVYGWR
jgi:hypothetical protein